MRPLPRKPTHPVQTTVWQGGQCIFLLAYKAKVLLQVRPLLLQFLATALLISTLHQRSRATSCNTSLRKREIPTIILNLGHHPKRWQILMTTTAQTLDKVRTLLKDENIVWKVCVINPTSWICRRPFWFNVNLDSMRIDDMFLPQYKLKRCRFWTTTTQ